MKNVITLLMVLSAFSLISSCDKDDDDKVDTKTLNLNISGLEDLGSDFAYEGWIMVDGAPKTTGIFTVDGNGALSKNQFELNAEDLDKATAFILTIEPSPDNDANPSAVHLIAGDFTASSANLTIDHGAAVGTSFSTATGEYILATPTDGGMATDENSGVWWLNPSKGPGRGLELPELGAGWKYEGWVVINGTPITTGKFTSVVSADDSAPYSSDVASGPPFPGEDFLLNAPDGVSFPIDLSGSKVVVSVEPEPDNSPAPFLLKPLVADVADPATDHTVYEMNNNASVSNPSGTASR